MAQQPKNVAPKSDDTVVGDARPYKYASREEKRKAAAAVTTPGWSLTNTVLHAHPLNRPKRDTSVKGKIYAMVVAAGKDGLTGAELVQKMLENPTKFQENPTMYTKGGKPAVGWCEDYVVGMTRNRFKFLTIQQPKTEAEKTPETTPAAGKPAEDPKPEEKKPAEDPKPEEKKPAADSPKTAGKSHGKANPTGRSEPKKQAA